MKNLSLDSSILDTLHTKFYTKLEAKPLINPKLVSVNNDLAQKLGFSGLMKNMGA